ncbi:MAG TPA: type II toxin-antitoxin system VapC family toxin [Thermoanaerobaculia bacterium]
MRFWDSSALVPLVSDESKTDLLNEISSTDPVIVIAFITPVEVESAVWRKARQIKDDVVRQRSQQRLAQLRTSWSIVSNFEPALEEARRMVARYGLRGADAIQLACGILAHPQRRLPFVTLDEELAAAARAEGFPILP